MDGAAVSALRDAQLASDSAVVNGATIGTVSDGNSR